MLFRQMRRNLSLAKRIVGGDRMALAKAITLVESCGLDYQKKAESLFGELYELAGDRVGKAVKIGFSGSPGVGKSSFIESFGLRLVGNGERLAVLTIDPSSSVSGGSILGDKTRMPKLSNSKNTFIRTSPSRGESGGVIASSFDAMKLCEYADYPVIAVESVGVGQSDLQMADLVDVFVLLVAPGVGDELQGLKRGITEIAQLILVNKADDEASYDANKTLMEYKSAMKLFFKNDPTKVLPVSAQTGRGINDCWTEIKCIAKREKEKPNYAQSQNERAQKWIEHTAAVTLQKQ